MPSGQAEWAALEGVPPAQPRRANPGNCPFCWQLLQLEGQFQYRRCDHSQVPHDHSCRHGPGQQARGASLEGRAGSTLSSHFTYFLPGLCLYTVDQGQCSRANSYGSHCMHVCTACVLQSAEPGCPCLPAVAPGVYLQHDTLDVMVLDVRLMPLSQT